MKCEIERMEIIYTFYFFAFLKKVIKKLLTFCYWSDIESRIGKSRLHQLAAATTAVSVTKE